MKQCLIILFAMSCLITTAEVEPAPQTGLILNTDKAYPGLNLFSPLDSGSTYLINNEGRFIREWKSAFRPSSVYLQEDGTLLRLSTYGRDGNGTFHGGGAGYCVEQFSWEGDLLWQYIYSSETHLMHHDIEALPNENILILAWEMKTKDEAILAGRDPELLQDGEVWPEHIIEVTPILPDGGKIVWEWHLWDHLVQDIDSTKENFGEVAAHPERVDLNPTGHWLDRVSDEEFAKLEALGYLGGGDTEDTSGKDKKRGTTRADWLHTNAIDYNPERDEIALSVLGNNELWIIDHSTTTEEAKGRTGGQRGKGGDILYRWGNPIAYRAGLENDQKLFAQHNVHWIEKGLPGAGNILLFNNGRARPEGNYSSIDELSPPLDKNGNYIHETGRPYAPELPTWEYTAPDDFFSSFISGALRLPNGNTLICQGADGTFFEVTHDKEVVWKYINPAVPIAPKATPNTSGKNGKAKKYKNFVYRVYRYGFDYPAFQGKDITPGPLLTDYLKDHPAVVPLELPDDMKKK